MRNKKILNICLSAMFLALGYVLPFLTGNLGSLGTMFCPMHLPVIICGFVCGWKSGLIVGFILPILRSYTLGMPADFVAFPMAFELAGYGLMTGLLYNIFPKKWPFLYVDLIIALVVGRVLNMIAKLAFLPLFGKQFVIVQVLVSLFVETWPAIVLQIVIVPILILALQRAKLIQGFEKKEIVNE